MCIGLNLYSGEVGAKGKSVEGAMFWQSCVLLGMPFAAEVTLEVWGLCLLET
ncbi:hypothetical protein Nmel_004791 [Mimus melanotis]